MPRVRGKSFLGTDNGEKAGQLGKSKITAGEMGGVDGPRGILERNEGMRISRGFRSGGAGVAAKKRKPGEKEGENNRSKKNG